ncbi:MAG TPA: exodeoxyribonuclease V subunit alpha, partial [Thermodesulfobacteriota bacterium]|nr:exodeoxyribonuclease V subunit alpha [Thermodesulfobacteriota bacterium]
MNLDLFTYPSIPNFFSDLDIHFADLMTRLSGSPTKSLLLAAALVSRCRREGHICLDLSLYAGKKLGEEGSELPMCPPRQEWLEDLEKAETVGRPGEYKPLVLDGTRLYLYRYWNYEKQLLDFLKARSSRNNPLRENQKLERGLARLFPQDEPSRTDWQKVAAYTAAIKKFCIISGGPGTGKTFTIAKILALLLELEDRPLRMALSAPTGKAAARLQEALQIAGEALNCREDIKAAIPREAATLHRLLKPIPDTPYFQHNAANPLPFDVVVIDEASMVDLALLSKLVQALSADSRLILLGDKDQLASVEAGAVLGDICDTGQEHEFTGVFREGYQRVTGEKLPVPEVEPGDTGIRDSIIQLKKSYRFGPSSGIGAVSRAVNQGESLEAMALLKNPTHKDIHWQDLPYPEILPSRLKELVVHGFSEYLRADSPESALALFGHFRILCALREGPFGVQSLNFQVEKILRQAGLIPRGDLWYPGRPVMVTRNDYTLKLFNGDIGIALMDSQADNQLRIFFPSLDGGVRKFMPLRLPEHETVYAMTVHKSQGSEFQRILFILPDVSTPLLTRELIYTALSRAREKAEIWAKDSTFHAAV